MNERWGRARRYWQQVQVITDRNDLDLIAAGVAFYGLLSIFPAVAALIAVFGLVADPAVVREQLELLQQVIPGDVFALFESQFERLLSAGGGALGWTTAVSVAIALWSARAGVGALMRGINAVFGAPARGGLWHMVVAMFLTLALVGVALVAMAAVVGAPILLALLPENAPTARVFLGFRWVVALSVLLVALGLLYRYGPTAENSRLGLFTPGAVLALAFWFAASMLFSTYLTYFGRFNEIYGSLGAVIALLMWFYISAYLVLLGAVLNVVVYREQ